MPMPLAPPLRFAWDWVAAWTGVFAANLPVPMFFGVALVSNSNMFGLFGALVILYLLGAMACGLRWRVGRSLVWGGLITAMFAVVSHVVAGYVAMTLWDVLTGSPSMTSFDIPEGAGGWELVRANFGVCTVVFLTALPLMVLAILIGAGIRVSRCDHPIWFSRQEDPNA